MSNDDTKRTRSMGDLAFLRLDSYTGARTASIDDLANEDGIISVDDLGEIMLYSKVSAIGDTPVPEDGFETTDEARRWLRDTAAEHEETGTFALVRVVETKLIRPETRIVREDVDF